MLEFYATRDLYPFPNDLPADRRPIGSMTLRQFESCRVVAEPCFEIAGIDNFSFFSDWIVSVQAQMIIGRCLEQRLSIASEDSRQGLEVLRSILLRSAGANVLAVCD